MNVFEKLVELFEKVFEGDVDVSNVNRDSRLVEDLGMQSIGMLYMALAIEEEFGVKFHNDDFAKIKTVEDIINKIEGGV
ncbi:MAG: acyl carrier protein [Lachnospiraceae bacterium]|nr:acyl carrier protein [Lachnospiraceae bacterium]